MNILDYEVCFKCLKIMFYLMIYIKFNSYVFIYQLKNANLISDIMFFNIYTIMKMIPLIQ